MIIGCFWEVIAHNNFFCILGHFEHFLTYQSFQPKRIPLKYKNSHNKFFDMGCNGVLTKIHTPVLKFLLPSSVLELFNPPSTGSKKHIILINLLFKITINK